jgi:serine protease Do
MTKPRPFASGAAVGAAAMLLVGAASYSVIAAADANHPVNPPGGPVLASGAAPSFADLVARVAPAVVSIDVVDQPGPNPVAMQGGQELPFPFDFGQGQGGGPFGFSFKMPQQQTPQPVRASGSGFFISPEGYIATNNHVVEGAQKITVHTSDGRELAATVVGRDPATDLAVIRVSGGSFPYVSFENRAMPRVGDWVVAVGNPFGLGGTATAGIVSALGRQNVSGSSYVDYMQIDAPINHGNSGGPTFDVEGHVVGVNTAIFSPSGGSVGIGFDIPADVAASVTRQLIEHGGVTRGYIGATVQNLTPDLAKSLGLGGGKGAIIDQLTAGGPAEQAGLRAGDVVTAVNGAPVASAAELTRQVGLARPGSDLTLAVMRDGAQRTVTIRSGVRPAEASLAENGVPAPGGEDGGALQPGALGLSVAPDPNGGVVVRGVAAGSDAAEKGLQAGDVILRAGAHRLASASDLSAAVAEARRAGRSSVPLLVARGGQRIFVPVQVGSAAG